MYNYTLIEVLYEQKLRILIYQVEVELYIF